VCLTLVQEEGRGASTGNRVPRKEPGLRQQGEAICLRYGLRQVVEIAMVAVGRYNRKVTPVYSLMSYPEPDPANRNVS
jgi:hypothetical protein